MNRSTLSRFCIGFIVGFVALVAICAGMKAHADPYIGQPCIYKYNSSYEYNCVVAFVTDPDPPAEVVLIAFSNGSTWYNSIAASVPAQVLVAVVEGSSDNRWRANPDIPAPGIERSLVTSQSTTSFSINGASAQLDTSRDVELTISVKIDLSITLLAGAGGTVRLFCDASSDPSTEVAVVAFAHGLGLNTTLSSTQVLRWRAAKNHYCKVTATNDVATPTFTIVRQHRQDID